MVLLLNNYKKKCAVPIALKKMAVSLLDSLKGSMLWKKSLKFCRKTSLLTLEIHLKVAEF